jgi:DNA-binding response OmpR family regulator
VTAIDALSLPDQVEHLKFMLSEMTTPAPDVVAGVHLTPSEKRILGLLMARRGTIVTTASLLAALAWDNPASEPHINIVKVYVCRLRQKGVPGRIETAHRIGYRWTE